MNEKTQPDTRQLRARGHKLKPVVTIAGKGVSESVLAELERALNDHELIKVRIAAGTRDGRDAVAGQVVAMTGARVVQRIGNVILLLRRTATPDPRLSNLLKPL